MEDITNQDQLQEVLSALSEQLERSGGHYEIVVVGGSALIALGFIQRPTKDVDVVALREAYALEKADPLPQDLQEASDRVARDFGLQEDWINSGPASLMDLGGLPDGLLDRVETRRFGRGLTVLFASRFDQIHFKLYALVDQGAGRHEQDLRALQPTADELLQAARWTRTHDISDGHRRMLEGALGYLGVEDADLGP